MANDIDIVIYEMEKLGFCKMGTDFYRSHEDASEVTCSVFLDDRSGPEGASRVMVNAWRGARQVWVAWFTLDTPPFVIMSAIQSAAEV